VDPSKAYTSASVSFPGVTFSPPRKDSMEVLEVPRWQVENIGLVEKRHPESVVSKPIESQPTV
jgi:hypothetical protein